MISGEALAQHIATLLDGNWDDGIDAYVEAFASDGDLRVNLRDDEGNLTASFDLEVTKTK